MGGDMAQTDLDQKLGEIERKLGTLKTEIESSTDDKIRKSRDAIIAVATAGAEAIVAAAKDASAKSARLSVKGFLAGVLYALGGVMAATTAITAALLSALLATGSGNSAAADPVRWVAVHFLHASYGAILREMATLLIAGTVIALVIQALRFVASIMPDSGSWIAAQLLCAVAAIVAALWPVIGFGYPAAREAACAGAVEAQASAALLKDLAPVAAPAERRRIVATARLAMSPRMSWLIGGCGDQIARWQLSQASLPPVPEAAGDGAAAPAPAKGAASPPQAAPGEGAASPAKPGGK